MVSTRHHPREFPPPATPSSTTSSPATNSKAVAKTSPPPSSAGSGSGSGSSSRSSKWVHTPAAVVTVWLTVAIPLVLWDVGYMLLRPHSMPGGKLHSLWSPYALYGTVDYNYGWAAYNSRQGFPGAQSWLNLFETLGYIYYLAVVYRHGHTVTSSGRASQKKQKKGLLWLLKDEKAVPGRVGAIALVIVFAANMATLSKTLLYMFIEFCGDFGNIGHNSLFNLIFLFIIPNGLWLVFPSYMAYILGGEIVAGLEGTTPRSRASRSKSS